MQRSRDVKNHLCVEESTSFYMHIYHSIITSLVQMPIKNARDMSINYIGILNDTKVKILSTTTH